MVDKWEIDVSKLEKLWIIVAGIADFERIDINDTTAIIILDPHKDC